MVFSSVFKDLKNMKTGEFCKTRNFLGKNHGICNIDSFLNGEFLENTRNSCEEFQMNFVRGIFLKTRKF